MKCSSGKVSYPSKDLAEEALIEVRGRFNFREGSGPVSVYQCDECGEWHFTSKGEPNKLLRSEEVQRRMNTEREAEYWSRKLR